MTDQPDKDKIFVGKITEIILSNLENENFGVNELARQAGMSHFVLSRKLHDAAGKTISQFIRETRLKRALELLQEGDITSAEVAYKTGFGSPTYFNTCFNDFFGYPPGTVKKGEFKINNKPNVVPESDKQKQKGKIIIASSVLIIAALLIILGYHIFTEESTDSASVRSVLQEKSVAVLPFKNLSDSAGNQYFADGITEDILTLLSRISDLRVISRTSVEQFRDSKLSTSEIAEKLKVKFIIEGSVQKSGKRFRLWIQLIDAQTRDHLWSEVYDGKYTTEIFEFQSSVARRVAESMNAIIKPSEEGRIVAKPTSDILAYDLYMRGSEMVRKFRFTKDSSLIKLALNLYNQALNIDPQYTRALHGKGMTYRELGKYDSSMVYYRKVNELDPESGIGFTGMGAAFMFSNQLDSSLFYYQKALNYRTNEFEPWIYLGIGQGFFAFRGELIKSLPYYQKAYDLAGDSWAEISSNVSYPFFFIGDYTTFLKYLRKALFLRSECPFIDQYVHGYLNQQEYNKAFEFLDSMSSITPCSQVCDIMRSRIYVYLRDYAKAEELYRKAVNSGYKETEDDGNYLGCILIKTGRKKEAKSLLKKSIESSEYALMRQSHTELFGKIRIYKLAAAYAMIGDNKMALEYLSEIEKLGFFEYPLVLDTFPGFDNLRNDPEFKAIVKRIEDGKASLRAQIKEMKLRGEIRL